MKKQVILGDDARKKLKSGIDTLANAVKATLGPGGRNVSLEKMYGVPVVTKDGVTVARNIDLTDPIENMGAQLIKEAAIRTGDLAGDGTTTATVIAQAIIDEGIKNIASGANPMQIRRGIDRAVEILNETIKSIAKPINTRDEMAQVATVSANNDEKIGTLIADVMAKVGKDGVITVDESSGVEDEVSYVDGMEVERGYISPYFVTNPDKQEAVLENVHVIVTDQRISAIQDLIPLMNQLMAQNIRSILIVAEDVDSEALLSLVANKVKGILQCAAIKAPGFGDSKFDMLEDLATLTGASLITSKLDRQLTNAKLEDIGFCKKIIIGRNKTTFIEGKEKEGEIEKRVALLKSQLENETSEYEKGKLKERIAKLNGGVAVLKVGAATEVEMKERKDRIEDALAATKAAVEEGIIAGGGVGYFDLANRLEVLDHPWDGDRLTGRNILIKALKAPLKQIAQNSGLNPDEASYKSGQGIGYNAVSGEFESMIDNGIVDPAKVARLAIQHGASVATMFLTTEAVVSQTEEEAKQPELRPQY